MKKNVLPEGTRDLILDECIIKRDIEKSVDDIFEKWGYEEIITPTVEFYETFNYNFQSLREEQMYKFFDNTGRILVLRPDMTIPIARVVETKFKDTKYPLKLRYTSNVFRVHANFGGMRNEYTDCGVELIGLEDKESDLEMIVLAIEALSKLKLNDFKLEIGNIDFFKGAFNNLNIREEEKEIIAQYIEDKNLKNLEDYLNSLNIKDEYKRFFNKLPWIFGNKSVLEEAKNLAFNNKLKESLEYLLSLYDELDELGYSDKVTFDLGMVPRLNYYTGIIFRGYGEGVGNTVLSGGRYDRLIKINNNYIPAIGFSVNIDSVISNIKYDEKSYKKEKYIIYYSSVDRLKAIRKGRELREKGFIVELIPKNGLINIEIVRD